MILLTAFKDPLELTGCLFLNPNLWSKTHLWTSIHVQCAQIRHHYLNVAEAQTPKEILNTFLSLTFHIYFSSPCPVCITTAFTLGHTLVIYCLYCWKPSTTWIIYLQLYPHQCILHTKDREPFQNTNLVVLPLPSNFKSLMILQSFLDEIQTPWHDYKFLHDSSYASILICGDHFAFTMLC